MTSDVPSADYADGTRLKLPHWLADDGYVHWDGGFIYDSARQEHCAFLRTTDGTLRCMPTSPAVVSGEELFADPACEEPLGSWEIGVGKAHRYFMHRAASGPCDDRYDFREAVFAVVGTVGGVRMSAFSTAVSTRSAMARGRHVHGGSGRVPNGQQTRGGVRRVRRRAFAFRLRLARADAPGSTSSTSKDLASRAPPLGVL